MSKQTTNTSEHHQHRIFLSDSLSWYTHTRLGGVLRDSAEAAAASSALASTGSTSSDFVTLTREVEWLQRDVVIFGKKVPQPRLIQYMADDVRLAYRYSGCDLVPVKFHPIVLQAKEQAETLAGVPRGYFNSCLLNRYRDGKDSNGWHADDEPLYGRDPIIASVSYGAARDFDIKRKADGPPEKARLRLCDGDVLIMGGAMQRNYLHCIPKRANSKVDGERINLKHVEVRDDVRMSQPLVDVHLANCVLDVGSLALLLPQIAQLMKLARHLAILLEIHGVPHLRKFTLANQAEQEIPPVEHRRL